MKNRKLKTFIGSLMMSIMLFNCAQPYYALAVGDQEGGATVVVSEDEAAEDTVSEGKAVSDEDKGDKEDSVSEGAVSEDAVSEDSVSNDTVEGNDHEDFAHGDEDDEKRDNDEQEEDVISGDAVVWQNPKADWYLDYKYELDDEENKIILEEANSTVSGNIVIPATATVDGVVYNVCIGSTAYSIWKKAAESITGIKIRGGVSFESNSLGGLFSMTNSALTTIDLTEIDTSGITSMRSMFSGCENVQNLDIGHFDTSSVTNMDQMFLNCKSLTDLDVSNFNTSNVTSMEGMFGGCESLTSLDVSNFDTSNVKFMSTMFSGLKSVSRLDLRKFNTSNVISMLGMFSGSDNLVSIDLRNFDTSNVIWISDMFSGCESLTSLDLSSFKTPNVEDMNSMFADCKSLTKLDLGKFNTAKVTDMSNMFSGCENIDTLNLGNFDTSKVTDMSCMFTGCGALSSLSISSFDTAKVTNMRAMFRGCSSLVSISISGFDTNKVTDMSSMFSECTQLSNVSLRGLNTQKVTDMSYMFYGCSDLSGLVLDFDTSNVTTMMDMFWGCESLESLNLSSFETAKLTNIGGMFYNCKSLKSVDFSNFDTTNVNRVYDKSSKNVFTYCESLSSIETPRTIGKTKIPLPAVFTDLKTGIEYTSLVPECADTILICKERYGFDLTENGHCIINMYKAFNYPQDVFTGSKLYMIPMERYIEVFGFNGVNIYNQIKSIWSGSCFGICSTAYMFYNYRLSLADYLEKDQNADGRLVLNDDGYNNIQADDNGYYYTYLNGDDELTKLIERYQIWQSTSECLTIKNTGLYNSEDNCDTSACDDVLSIIDNTKEPLFLSVQWDDDYGNRCGHALLIDTARKSVSLNGVYHIPLYDPNNPYFHLNDSSDPDYDLNRKFYASYNRYSGRELILDKNNGQWRIENISIDSNSSRYGVGYINGSLSRNSTLKIYSGESFPDKFGLYNSTIGQSGATTISYHSDDFAIYDASDVMIYQKIDGKTVFIDENTVDDYTNDAYVEDLEVDMAQGILKLAEGTYKAVLKNGTIAFWSPDSDYAGVMTESDTPVTIVNTDSTTLSVKADENALVDLVIMDTYGSDNFTCVQTDVVVGADGCDMSLKSNMLNIDTHDNQKFDIDIEADNGYGEAIGVSSNDVTDLDITPLISSDLIEYSISYNLNGGTVSGNPVSYNRETGTFTLINPIKDGADFIGWTESNGNVPQTYVVIGLGEKGDRTYTANWSDGTGDDPTLITAVKLDETTLDLTLGGPAEQLTATVVPEDAVFSGLTWSSSDESVALVSDAGLVSPVGVGKATITVSINDTDIEATCEVTVKASASQNSTSVNKITLDKGILNFTIGDAPVQLTATVEPEDADATLIWSTTDEAVATVSDNGLVTPVGEGNAIISVSADGVKAECMVTVKSKLYHSPMDPNPLITDSTTSIYLVKGQKFILTGGTADWTSSDKSKLSINNKGNVTAKKVTSDPIKLYWHKGSEDEKSYDVYITDPKISPKSHSLLIGEKDVFKIDNLGALEAEYGAVWTSSDYSVADVIGGEVHAISKGTAKITAYINGVRYTCRVKVTDHAKLSSVEDSIQLTPMQTIKIKKGAFKAGKAKWESDLGMETVMNASGSKVTGYMDDVVYITSAGKLTAIGAGTTKISGTDNKGNTISFTVTVNEPVTRVIYLEQGKNKTIKLYNVKNAKAEWSVQEGSDFASVSNKGKVTGLKVGESEILCRYSAYKKGGFSYRTIVHVEDRLLVADRKLTNAGARNNGSYKLQLNAPETYAVEFKDVVQPVLLISNKPTIAFADETGVIHAVSPGTAKLTAKINGKKVSITVTVK